ncbi:uncharacterized protein E0L32_009306, partial [Thyridium curvatum]
MPPPDLQAYALSPEESERIFLTQIYPQEIAPFAEEQQRHPHNNKQPLAVLLVGQTGAGKTRTAPSLSAALTGLRRRRPAHFIADTYKTHHPAYAAIAASPDPSVAARASVAASPAARAWLT